MSSGHVAGVWQMFICIC